MVDELGWHDLSAFVKAPQVTLSAILRLTLLLRLTASPGGKNEQIVLRYKGCSDMALWSPENTLLIGCKDASPIGP